MTEEVGAEIADWTVRWQWKQSQSVSSFWRKTLFDGLMPAKKIADVVTKYSR